jgi:hypothetical protein
MYTAKDKARITREVTSLVLNRAAKMCNILEYKEQKIVYKRCVSGPPGRVRETPKHTAGAATEMWRKAAASS